MYKLMNSSLLSSGFFQKPDDSNIYLICRGTTSKKNLIAKNFNISNQEITHIGIGFKHQQKFTIYNVSYDKKINNNSLLVETLDDFISIPDIFHLEIWQLPLKSTDVLILKQNINKDLVKEIGFDYRFNLDDNENFYCSEFVAKILNELNDFQYKSNKKQSNKLLKSIIKSDVFEYFPVDFFLQNPNVIQVYEKSFDLK